MVPPCPNGCKSHYWFKSYGNFAEKSEYFLLDKVVKLVGGGSVINRAYPVQFSALCLTTPPPPLRIVNNLFCTKKEQSIRPTGSQIVKNEKLSKYVHFLGNYAALLQVKKQQKTFIFAYKNISGLGAMFLIYSNLRKPSDQKNKHFTTKSLKSAPIILAGLEPPPLDIRPKKK